MPEQTNPTRRLYDILDAAISAQNRLDQAQGSNVIWLKLLNLGPKDDFFDALSRIFSIIDSYESFVKRNSAIPAEKQTRHLEQIRQIKIAFFNAKQAGWSGLSHNIDHNLLTSLRWAADDMDQYWYEELISLDELERLQLEVEELTEEVVKSDIDSELKSILRDGLEHVRQAILNYRISGAEGIRDALDRNIDITLRNRDEFIAVSDAQGYEVVRRTVCLLASIDKAVSKALKIKQVIGQAIPLIGPAIAKVLESGS